MNDRELTFYLLGLLGDSTKDEAIKMLEVEDGFLRRVIE